RSAICGSSARMSWRSRPPTTTPRRHLWRPRRWCSRSWRCCRAPERAGAEMSMTKTRLMPEGLWDWPVPVPFSQGWRVGGDFDLIFVGGQISVDEHNNVIGEGDIEVQTRTVFENIGKVLREAGADYTDLVKFNTFYHFDGTGEQVQEFW